MRGKSFATCNKQRFLPFFAHKKDIDGNVVCKFIFTDIWSWKVFVALLLLRRYDLRPYRYYRQRYTTVMVRVPERFVDKTLWPEFQKIRDELNAYLEKVTDRIVKKVLHEDSSDTIVVDEPHEH